jgi:hypothetical protein
MPQVMPSVAVDTLPEGLWSAGNLYRFFGQDLHFCVGDGVRTIELNGRQVAHGVRPFVDFADDVTDETAVSRWRFDLGWLVVGALAGYLALAGLGRRLIKRPIM